MNLIRLKLSINDFPVARQKQILDRRMQATQIVVKHEKILSAGVGILSIDRTIEKMKRTKLVTWSNNIQKMHEGAEKRRREQLEITSGEKLRKDGKLM